MTTEDLQFIAIILQDMFERFIEFLPSLIAALVIFFFALYFAGLFSRIVGRGLERRQATIQVSRLLTKIAYWSVLVLGIVVALQQVRFNVTAFLTGLGIVGFTIGFALQDISKNFVSGLILSIQQPFLIGDSIEVTGFTGKVIAIDLRATEIQTQDGRLVLIPNADIITKPIINFSRASHRRIEVGASVAYQSDLEAARQAALKAIAPITGLIEDPSPFVNFHAFTDSKIDLTVNYWIDLNKTTPLLARDAGVTRLKSAFDEAGIEIR